jgi:hypothetical protein
MINNTKILYHQTNRKLNSFLLNNFSSNSLIKYKFPIKKPNSSLMKKPSIKRKSTIVKRRPNSSEKTNSVKIHFQYYLFDLNNYYQMY